mgnify:FL=1
MRDIEFTPNSGDVGPSKNDGDASTNWLPYITFNGSTTSLVASANAAFDQGTGEYSMVVLARFDGTGSNETLLAKDGSSSEWQLKKDTNDKITVAQTGSDPLSAALSADTWYIIEWSQDDSDVHTIYIDGSASGSTATTATDYDDNEKLFIGRKSGGTSHRLDGDIAEIFYYNDHELTSLERASVVTYLQDKYFNQPVARQDFTGVDGSDVVVAAQTNKIIEFGFTKAVNDSGLNYTAQDIIGLRIK